MKKVIALLLVCLICLSLLGGCGNPSTSDGTASSPGAAGASPGGAASGSQSGSSGSSSAASPSGNLPDKKFTIALQQAANANLDPGRFPQSAVGDRSVGEMVYEPLLMSDGFGEIYPWLAESYEYNEDATEWIFKIRKDVYFSNGELMNADDVVCSYNRTMEEYSGPNAAFIKSIIPNNLLAGIEKIDDYTVKVFMSYTYAGTILAFTDIMIIPDELYAERGADLFTDQTLTGFIGTGPWIMKENFAAQKTSFVKNTNYWNKSYDSYFDEVEFLFIVEQTTALAACISREVDAWVPAGGISQDLISQLDAVQDTYNVFITPQKSFCYFQFNCGEGKPFNDIKVRQAWSKAVNLDEIVTYVFGGGTAMNQLLPEGYEGYNADLPKFEQEIEEAKRLLAESSYDGTEIVLLGGNTTVFIEDQLLSLADYATAVGFNVSPQVVDNALLQELRTAGNYDAFIAMGNMNDASPLVYLTLRVRDDAHKHNLNDELLYNLIDEGSKTVDKAARSELFKQAMARTRELNAPSFGLYFANPYAAVGYGIKGMELDVGGQMYFTFIDFNVDDPTSTEHGVDWDTLLKY